MYYCAMTMEYKELSKTKLSVYTRLKTSKFRRKEGLFTVEGTKCVEDTLNCFKLVALVATSTWIQSHPHIANINPDLTFTTPQASLDKISTFTTPPEVIAVYQLPENQLIPENLSNGIYLILDGIQDPGNLGTIIRTAHWFGIKYIFASKNTVDAYNPKTIQASMGSISSVKIYYCDLPTIVDNNPHISVCCLDLNGKNIFAESLPKSAFIVMGNEGHGISEEMRMLAEKTYFIPAKDPANHPDSLMLL